MQNNIFQVIFIYSLAHYPFQETNTRSDIVVGVQTEISQVGLEKAKFAFWRCVLAWNFKVNIRN